MLDTKQRLLEEGATRLKNRGYDVEICQLDSNTGEGDDAR